MAARNPNCIVEIHMKEPVSSTKYDGIQEDSKILLKNLEGCLSYLNIKS
jgi:hypothetical protein